MPSRRYLVVVSTAILCYAALGTVLGILPEYVHSLGGGALLVGFAVGAPALTGAACRPFGGRFAARGPVARDARAPIGAAEPAPLPPRRLRRGARQFEPSAARG